MKIESIDYYNNYSFVVSFLINGVKCTGELIIEQTKLPILKIKNSEGNIEYHESLDIEGDVLCEEVVGRNSFRLHGCECSYGIVYPKFITNGHQSYKSNKLQVFLTGISEWFDGMRGYNYENEKFTRDISIDKMKASFHFKGVKYEVENDRDVNVISDSTTNHTINIEYSLFITKGKGIISYDEVSDIIREIRNLFSILLGTSLSVKCLFLISKDSNKKYSSIYFYQHRYDEKPLRHIHETFCPFSYIMKCNLFPTIIESFFAKKSFSTIWNRLIPIFNGVETWDLDILSNVVALEMYCSLVSRGQGHKLDLEIFNKLKDGLVDFISDFSSKYDLNDSDLSLLEGLKSAVNGLKNTSHPTLKEKYEFLLEGVSPSIKEAIAFSENDFNVIRKIRNSVAHGLKYSTLKKGDITQELQIKSRLTLFLMYLAYRELGFSDEQFAFCIHYTHSPILRGSGYNERGVDKLAKTAEFITLDKISLNDYITHKPIVIWRDLSNDSYSLDENLSYEVQNNWPDNKHKDARDFVRSFITEAVTIDYLSKVYLNNGECEKLHYGVLLVVKCAEDMDNDHCSQLIV
ncbi:HEPN domain-containing protein [Citrobacter sp. Cb014]|uniref:ApeA N-terminal domain 1-containing protein n=1 Tax=Citrobacter sp. Cb014 TaxID=2985014 RepID=UPI001816C54D|nr:HEPN domain-containing protein [Citrobacter sp. Cb014]EFE7862559.1 hypothetical protein [Escherichia coli]MDM3394180.1 hypothetical protein [Citrobacter sp. Cb014]